MPAAKSNPCVAASPSGSGPLGQSRARGGAGGVSCGSVTVLLSRFALVAPRWSAARRGERKRPHEEASGSLAPPPLGARDSGGGLGQRRGWTQILPDQLPLLPLTSRRDAERARGSARRHGPSRGRRQSRVRRGLRGALAGAPPLRAAGRGRRRRG